MEIAVAGGGRDEPEGSGAGLAGGEFQLSEALELRHATYVAFPAGTVGHPADLDVEVRVVTTSDWTTPIGRYPVMAAKAR